MYSNLTLLQKRDRVTLPLLKSLDQLLTSGFLDPVMEDADSPFPSELLARVKAEVSRCGDPSKLMAACDVLCALLQSADQKCVTR